MNVKNFLIAGLVGFIVDFLLGWLLWGVIFADYFPQGDEERMPFIALGCLAFAMTLSYIFVRWAHITDALSGLKAGAILSFFMALFSNSFQHAMDSSSCIYTQGYDLVLTVLCGAIVGSFIAVVNGKLK